MAMNNEMNAKDIKSSHGKCCAADRMREGRCCILPPPGQRFTVSGTAYQKIHGFTDKLCDYIVFWNHPGLGESIAIVELKGGHVPADSAEQLKNGANVAKSLAKKPARQFAAILVTKQAIHSIDRKYIASQKIRYNGVSYPIQVISCGSQITDALPWSVSKSEKQLATSQKGVSQPPRERSRTKP